MHYVKVVREVEGKVQQTETIARYAENRISNCIIQRQWMHVGNVTVTTTSHDIVVRTIEAGQCATRRGSVIARPGYQ